MKTPGLLVTPAWRSGHLKHPAVAIVDVRWSPKGGITATRRDFEDGHVPGAGFFDVDRDLSGAPFVGGPGRHPLPDPEVFRTERLAAWRKRIDEVRKAEPPRPFNPFERPKE